MTNTALILGASGKFGGHCARAFEKSGWTVVRFQRGKQNMKDAARGADIIVNGLNPPNYENWGTALPAITKEVIAAAKSSGATIIQPGNVYNFGRDGGVWGKNTPQSTHTVKGQIRIGIEKLFRDASYVAGVQTIILRAGDFIDDTNSGNWFDISIAAKLDKGIFTYPGKTNIPHAWAFLPDLARAAVMLAEKRTDLAMFEDVPFGGHTLTGENLKAGFEKIAGQSLKQKGFPWFFLIVASPFWRLGKELLEMRYLWDTPHQLDNSRLAELLPEFKATAIDTVLHKSVSWQLKNIPNAPAIAVH